MQENRYMANAKDMPRTLVEFMHELRIVGRTSKRKFYSTSKFEWTSTGEPGRGQLAVSIKFCLDTLTTHWANSMRREWHRYSNPHFLFGKAQG